MPGIHFTYCPDCGSKLVDRQAGDEGLVPFCNTCGHYWFDVFASCAIILIYNADDEIVVLRQSYLSDFYGTFVSGYITPGETPEECAVREAKEEIGVDLLDLEYGGCTWFSKKGLLMHGFLARAERVDFTLSSEVDEARWIPADEVPDHIFPETPENAAFALYRRYLAKRSKSEL